jgi:hypothetical protein
MMGTKSHCQKLQAVGRGQEQWRPFTHRQANRDLAVTRDCPPSEKQTQVPINAASSTGRCNTTQCFDSTMLPREKRSVWLYSVKT